MGGKGKKKRQRAPKKAGAAGPFTLNVDSFEQFGLVGLNPPTKLEMVEQSVKDLRAKKQWYKEQPRGSVPTAKDVRKQNEKSFAKMRQTPSPSVTSGGGKSGKGSSSSVDASSWGSGQKPTPMTAGTDVASTEDP